MDVLSCLYLLCIYEGCPYVQMLMGTWCVCCGGGIRSKTDWHKDHPFQQWRRLASLTHQLWAEVDAYPQATPSTLANIIDHEVCAAGEGRGVTVHKLLEFTSIFKALLAEHGTERQIVSTSAFVHQRWASPNLGVLLDAESSRCGGKRVTLACAASSSSSLSEAQPKENFLRLSVLSHVVSCCWE